MPPKHNPYIAGDPVGKTEAFVGREDVLREVLRVLRHPRENAITLYGQRRIGKTSILQRLEVRLPQEGAYLPVYFDLMAYSGQPLDILLRALAEKIAHAVGQPAPQLGHAPHKTFRETWLPHLLQALPADQRLVLLMDEFDVQADPQADQRIKKDFFTYMRDLRRLDTQRLKFVFVLGRTLDDLDIVAKGLFKDLPSKRVSLLARPDAERLIRLSERQGSLGWTEAAVARVWDLTHGQPYLVQALCSEVWERAHEEEDAPPPVTPEQVDEAVPAAMERSANMFTWLWDGLGPAEKVVAAALAEAGPVVVDEERLRQILTESGVRIVIRELQDAPRLLQQWDILEPVDGGYRFRVELLRRWIAENKPLRRTQEELDRINPLADSLYQAGKNYYTQGNLEEARGLLERAINANPSHQGALELLAEIHLAQGDLDAAQTALETLAELSPARARSRLKQVYLRRAEQAETDEAKQAWYEKILALLPQDPDAVKGIEEIEARLRRRAVEAALKEIAALEEKGAYREALSLARQTAAQYPQERDWEPDLVRLEKEVVQEEARRRKKAVAAALKEIAALEDKRAYQEALTLARQTAAQYPQERDWEPDLARLEQKTALAEKYTRALGLLEHGEPDKAARLLGEVLALEPKYEEAARYLYLAVTGEDPAEIAAQRRALQKEHDALQQAYAQEKEQHAALESTKASLEQELAETKRQLKKQLKKQNAPSLLSPWNPLDYLRLLWWALATPQRLAAYRDAHGEGALKAVGNRLAYTLAMLPILMTLWGMALGEVPYPGNLWWFTSWLRWAEIATGFWLMMLLVASGWVDEVVDSISVGIAMSEGWVLMGLIALAIEAPMTKGLTGVMANGVAIGVKFGVTSSAAFVVISSIVGAVIALAIAVMVIVVGMIVNELLEGTVWIFVVVGIIMMPISAFVITGSWVGSIASIAALIVSGILSFGVGKGLKKNAKAQRPTRWALVLLFLSWLALAFFSFGGLVWLQTGVWPRPVWRGAVPAVVPTPTPTPGAGASWPHTDSVPLAVGCLPGGVSQGERACDAHTGYISRGLAPLVAGWSAPHVRQVKPSPFWGRVDMPRHPGMQGVARTSSPRYSRVVGAVVPIEAKSSVARPSFAVLS